MHAPRSATGRSRSRSATSACACGCNSPAAAFASRPRRSETALRIVAPLESYLRLLRGEDDADRLFFERALVMEGDTEMGLVLKNTLDAIGPLWR
jgi:predicted lipid carrier protein YhbT